MEQQAVNQTETNEDLSFFTILELDDNIKFSQETPPDDYFDESFLCDEFRQLKFLDKKHNSSQWLRYYKYYTSPDYLQFVKGDLRTRLHHGIRTVIQLHTFDYISSGRYPLETGNKYVQLNLKKMNKWVCQTKLYPKPIQFTTEQLSSYPTHETKYYVIEGDCLDVAHWLQTQNLNPLVLNMANATTPGGGYRHGAGAQEENLHRRSNLFQSLEDPNDIQKGQAYKRYPIPSAGGIYSPKIVVFRGAESRGYPLLEHPTILSFIAVAALSRPTLIHTKNGQRLSEEALEITNQKIETIFSVALQNGHDSLVLSALGCGAFRNPPRDIAKVFHDVAMSGTYKGKFKVVAFGIFNDHNARGEGNIKPFADTFGVQAIPLSDMTKL